MLIWELISWSVHANLMEDDGLCGHGNAQVGQMCSFASCNDLQTVLRGESESKSREKLEPIYVFHVKLFTGE